MSLLDSIKKGLMGEGDEYEDQYIDDGPQMVNNNSGVGIGMDEETEELSLIHISEPTRRS